MGTKKLHCHGKDVTKKSKICGRHPKSQESNVRAQGLRPEKSILGTAEGSFMGSQVLRHEKSESLVLGYGEEIIIGVVRNRPSEVFASLHAELDGALSKRNSQYAGQTSQSKCQTCRNIPKCGRGLCKKPEIIVKEEIIECEVEAELEKAESKTESIAKSESVSTFKEVSVAETEAEDDKDEGFVGCLDWSKLKPLLVFTIGSFLTMRMTLVALELG